MIKTYQPNHGLIDSSQEPMYGFIFRNTIKQTKVSVGATAVALPTTALSKRCTLFIFNNSANILYLGDSTVATTDGMPVYPHGAIMFNVEDDVVVYGIASGAASDIRIIEGA